MDRSGNLGDKEQRVELQKRDRLGGRVFAERIATS